ncbi:hypothetical protein BP6252_13722 [Coleophoma cylindrospora]|uniref:Xylanolytic transcriptional activator regulatory domain-containing protein n=1 Tax=Coleophoma cylindrospora TaxID=1849047 RepID=A0A3D8Q7K2_9HELO|nr:hypothetical protein BP6252_13722 [Coleophoma cylindrospora]
MRACAAAQLHLANTEPRPLNGHIHVEIQMHRRIFWCAYHLDRLVSAAFDLPVSIPDTAIDAKIYANVDDKDLIQVAFATPPGTKLKGSNQFTEVSPALHIIQIRRIQSEILNYTLNCGFAAQFAAQSDWRNWILSELKAWKSQVHHYTEPGSKGYTSSRWFAIIYHCALLMLYRPTKDNVLGPAGDWSVQASTQACLAFRKSQMDRQVALPWLALLFQFQSGITLLYCFWATPERHRTPNFESSDIWDALRACSNTFAIMADHWPTAECLRDVFELLARGVPLVGRLNRDSQRISPQAVIQIQSSMPSVRSIVINRSVLRMIEEMITEDFPGADNKSPPLALDEQPQVQYTNGSTINGISHPSCAPLTFEMPFLSDNWQTLYDGGINLQEFGNDTPLFPGLFDI